MPRFAAHWTRVAFFLAGAAALEAVELPPDEETFINQNVSLRLAGKADESDAALAEHVRKLEPAEAALDHAERGHRLFLHGADGAPDYAAALKIDPQCHLAEVYSVHEELDRGDFAGALRKLHPETDDAPEGVEWGMYALVLQLRGHPEDRAKIREALDACRARTMGDAGYETLQAGVLTLTEDGDYPTARRGLAELKAMAGARPEADALEKNLTALEKLAQYGNLGKITPLLDSARTSLAAGRFPEALAFCTEADGIAEIDATRNLVAEIDFAWFARLWAEGRRKDAAEKLHAALAVTRSGAMQERIRARLRELRDEAVALFKHGDYEAVIPSCDTLLLVVPHDHDITAIKATSWMKQGRYPEAVRAWMDVATNEEEPDAKEKLAYDKRGLTETFVDAYQALQKADAMGADCSALCRALTELGIPLMKADLSSATSHVCLGFAFDLLGRTNEADTEWKMARNIALPDEKTHAENLIRSLAAQREVRRQCGANYVEFRRYGGAVQKVFDEWSTIPGANYHADLGDKLSPALRDRLNGIGRLFQSLREYRHEVNELTRGAEVATSNLQASPPTEQSLAESQRRLEEGRARLAAITAETERIGRRIESEMKNFWQP